MAKKQPENESQRRHRTLDSAVRKVESRERRQDKQSGRQGKPVRSTGRDVHKGRKDGA